MALPTTYSWTVSSEGGGAIGGQAGLSGAKVGFGKTGIAIPVSSDGRGRMALVSGENQLRKLILLNMMDLESANPFQGDIGIGASMIFQNDTPLLQAELRRRISVLFRRLQLQDRAKLSRAVSFTSKPETQDLEAEISYVNLEENKPFDVQLRMAAVPTGDVSKTLVTALKGV